ncbi:phytanoyl-CoA dioxygenase family protein [Streptomyces sp. NBC_00038]|uniref:phytanoyl-CoA dioxygenase family protein n=1 Tax=Streptomyces sp. NBC_00038 TaxID=2903615 RepID=UPI00225366EA|nr:phytanoyl-CoA dioxygenase family protein [Streptomyces sp. NBC_00038]MCX5555389.1 phytanoyl-CoA dioxygenase family protein [Streptomyces sp. NBC_00038]
MTLSESTANLIADVQKQGFAIWPGFLQGERCDEIRRLAEHLAGGEHANRYPKSTRVWDLYRHGEEFVDLLADPDLTAVLNGLLGENHLVSDYSLNVVQPGQPVDGWHIDYPYNEMPAPVTGAVLGLQCVLALDSFRSSNGATQLVPESHARTDRPDPDAVIEHAVFDGEPGALLIMAAATWHRSGFNASAAPRSAVLMSFVEKWVRPMSDPPEPGPWGRTDALRILLGMQRPPETINGVAI